MWHQLIFRYPSGGGPSRPSTAYAIEYTAFTSMQRCIQQKTSKPFPDSQKSLRDCDRTPLQKIPKIQRDRPKPSQNRLLWGDLQETRCETAAQKTDVAICRHARSDGRFRKSGELPSDGNWQVLWKRIQLKLQVALDELAELLAVFVVHVDEFDAVAVGADIANDGGEIDLAETGANLELDGIADSQLPWRFQVCAAQADGPDASETCRCALDLRAKGRFGRNSHIAARDDVIGARLCRRAKCCLRLFERRTIFDQSQSIRCSGA